MTAATTHSTVCHRPSGASQTADLDSMLVLDAYMGPTDLIARCRTCGTYLLLNMLDLSGADRLFACATVPQAAAEATIHSLGKGSCDLSRASAEIAHLQTLATPVAERLLATQGAFTCWMSVQDTAQSQRSWRERPCDGTLIQPYLIE